MSASDHAATHKSWTSYLSKTEKVCLKFQYAEYAIIYQKNTDKQIQIRKEHALTRLFLASGMMASKVSNILNIHDVPNIWHILLLLWNQNAHEAILKQLNCLSICNAPNFQSWTKMAESYDNLTSSVKIAMVGKYVGLSDSYLSVVKRQPAHQSRQTPATELQSHAPQVEAAAVAQTQHPNQPSSSPAKGLRSK